MRKYSDNPWIDPCVEIKPSPIHRNGMFAKSPIAQGEVVVIWGGKYVGKEEAEKARREGKIAQQIDEDTFDVYSREEANQDPTWFMNHSCDPNVWMKDEVTLVARHDIKRGEELTGDYAMWEAEEDEVKSWECKCESPLCRKRVTGKDWMLKELQDRYDKHFSPLINRRITRSRKSGALTLHRLLTSFGKAYPANLTKVLGTNTPVTTFSILMNALLLSDRTSQHSNLRARVVQSHTLLSHVAYRHSS